MEEFITCAIIMTFTLGAFISTMLVTALMENKKTIVKNIATIIIAVAIGCLSGFALMSESNADDKAWNNGYCTQCRNPYRFVNADRSFSTTHYYWSCDNCGKVIELQNNYSK